jgi:hypothetical protein
MTMSHAGARKASGKRPAGNRGHPRGAARNASMMFHRQGGRWSFRDQFCPAGRNPIGVSEVADSRGIADAARWALPCTESAQGWVDSGARGDCHSLDVRPITTIVNRFSELPGMPCSAVASSPPDRQIARRSGTRLARPGHRPGGRTGRQKRTAGLICLSASRATKAAPPRSAHYALRCRQLPHRQPSASAFHQG